MSTVAFGQRCIFLTLVKFLPTGLTVGFTKENDVQGFQTFVSLARLQDATRGLLVNDTVKIKVWVREET